MAGTTKTEKFSFPRRNSSSNFTSKRNAAGNFSDVQSDIVINVDGVNFSLHKFPLLSRSGRIRRLAEELSETDALANPVLDFSEFPGGPDVFELAAKFCYGINFEITTGNVAQLRCAAEFLEMTEDYGEENLVSRTEAFLNELVFESIEKSAAVLHACEPILQHAEEVKLVNRCIDAIASKVCKEDMVKDHIVSAFSSSGRANNLLNDAPNTPPINPALTNCKAIIEWWVDEITDLRIDLFQRLLSAMKSRGIRNESLGGALIHYAQKTLKPLSKKGNYDAKSKVKLTLDGLMNSKAMEHEQRILVESIVSMLPQEKHIFSTHFLLGLLRTAIILDTTVACRLDLERRVGAQLENASVDDLLIPAGVSHAAGDGLFDADVVQRVLVTYLQQQEEASAGGGQDVAAVYESDDSGSPSQRGIMKVAKLMDMYLAEIAPDANLKASKFVSLAELLPEYARVLDDGLYRAIDIFLKAHPTLSDLERKKLCKLLDCQKLSQEACTHAAQNERLPVQLVVQVLYFEQLRMRNAMAGSTATDDQQFPPVNGGVFYGRQQHRMTEGAHTTALGTSPRIDPYSNLRRDNRELKLEVARLRLRVNDLEKENGALKQELLTRPPAVAVNSAGGGGGGFFSLISRRFGRMGLFASSKSPREGSKLPSEHKPASRRRRHSIS